MLKIHLPTFLLLLALAAGVGATAEQELMNAQSFLDGNCFQEILDEVKKSATKEQGNQLNEYVFKWLPAFLESSLENDSAKEINGNSGKFSIMVAPIPLNDNFVSLSSGNPSLDVILNTPVEKAVENKGFSGLNEKMALFAGFYRTDLNLLFLDPRIELPAQLWAVVIVHELRHGYDELRLQNKLPEDKKALIELEINGRMAGIVLWRLMKEKILESWRRENRDNAPEYLSAKLAIFDLLYTEVLAEEYLKGNKKPFEAYLQDKIIFIK